VQPDNVFEMTKFHQRVIEWLAEKGLRYMEEVNFPPYRVDIYLPDYHVAVEADGMHGADLRRDARLGEVYSLPVSHVDVHMMADRELADAALRQFLDLAQADAGERWLRAKDKVPWL
jgi:hypothetical protein